MLASLFSRKKVRTRKTGCLGKLPCHGDFLRHNAVHEESRWLDRWVREGIVASRRHLGPDWARVFDSAPPTRLFAHRPESGRTLCVRFQPAFDSVGRRYPFLMFRLENPPHGRPGIAPLVPALGPFFRRAREVASRGGSPGPRGEFLRRVEALNRDDLPMFEPERFDKWLESQTVGDIFGRIFGDAGDKRKFSLVANVLGSVGVSNTPGAALRLPDSSHPGDVAFWIALIEGRRRANGLPYTLLWSRPLDGASSAPVLQFGDPAPENFMLLIDPRLAGRSILETAPKKEARREEFEGLRRRLGHLLEDHDLPLRLLLDYLCMLNVHRPMARRDSLAMVA